MLLNLSLCRQSNKSTLVTILETESRHINQPGSRIFLCIFLCLFSNLIECFKSATKLLSVNQLSLEVKMFFDVSRSQNSLKRAWFTRFQEVKKQSSIGL